MAKPKPLAANKLHNTLSSDPNNELAQIVKNTIAKVRPVGADGQKHDYITADFSKPNELFDKVSNYLAKNNLCINILVNNSGGPPGGPITESKILEN